MKLEDSTAYTARCFRGEPASCSYACPFHLDIRSLLEKVSKGRWVAAYKILRDATVFPGDRERALRSALPGALPADACSATKPSRCAISKPRCLRYAKDRKAQHYVIPPKAQRIAVVGAGTAGLSCALNLAQKNYQVTVFEKESGWGGTLRSHPRFAEFDADIALQFSAVKAEFRYGTEIRDARRAGRLRRGVRRDGSRRRLLRTSRGLGTRSAHDLGAQGVHGRHALRGDPHGGHRPGRGGLQDHRGVPADRQGQPAPTATTTRRGANAISNTKARSRRRSSKLPGPTATPRKRPRRRPRAASSAIATAASPPARC